MQLKPPSDVKSFINEANAPKAKSAPATPEPKPEVKKSKGGSKRVNILLSEDELGMIEEALKKEGESAGFQRTRHAFMKALILEGLQKRL